MLLRITFALLLFATAHAARGEVVPVGPNSVAAYIQSCRKPNGAFGPREQQYTDAAWNYPAIHALALLGQPVDQPQQVLQHGLGYPLGHAGCGHWLVYHQSLLTRLLTAPPANPAKLGLEALGEDAPPVDLVHQGYEVRYYGSPLGTDGDRHFKVDGASTWKQFRQLQALGYYNLPSLYYLLAALATDGRRPQDPQALANFIRQRQAPGGGFVDLRDPQLSPLDHEAHVAHTFHAVAALTLLGQEIPRAADCLRFLRDCQTDEGGFGWNPDQSQLGNEPDVYYAWAATRALGLLGEQPRDVPGCQAWLNSLQNADGGFGDQPGWRSRLYSTYYAVHALALLSQDGSLGITDKKLDIPAKVAIEEDNFRIYQTLFKMPILQPDELPSLAERGFHLLAIKSRNFEDAQPLLERIRTPPLALDVILCPELYPHRAIRRQGAKLHHIANVTLDPGWDESQVQVWKKAQLAGRYDPPWPEYQQTVLQPLEAQGSICYPEHEFEMEYAYNAYGEGGYNAILTGFNWSPRDFVRVFPWRERYVDKRTPVSDCDAHGDLAKWSPQLDHTRMLYITRGPGYNSFLDAARNGRVVSVIYGGDVLEQEVTYYGPPAAVEYVRQREEQWKWWE